MYTKIISPKFVVKKVENQHVLNGRTDFLVTTFFLNRNQMFKESSCKKFKIDRTILTCLNQQKELSLIDGRTDVLNKDLL